MKSLIKTALLFLNAALHRDTSPKVVFYHDIGTKYTPMGTPESLFWVHMAYLRKVKVRGEGEERLRHRSPTPTFHSNSHMVAFDDGFRGIWDARARLKVEVDSGLKVIVFIAIDLVGKPRYLTWYEIRTLQNEYGVNFQCHTWSHQTLVGPVNTDLPPPATTDFRTDDWYYHELVDSKNELEKQLGEKVDSLCFPVGYFSDAVLKRCVDAGYSNLYASFPGNIEEVVNSIIPHSSFLIPHCRLIPRCLCQFSSLLEFKAILHGGMNPIRNRYLARHYLDNK